MTNQPQKEGRTSLARFREDGATVNNRIIIRTHDFGGQVD